MCADRQADRQTENERERRGLSAPHLNYTLQLGRPIEVVSIVTYKKFYGLPVRLLSSSQSSLTLVTKLLQLNNAPIYIRGTKITKKYHIV